MATYIYHRDAAGKVANAPGSAGVAVADTTLALMLVADAWTGADTVIIRGDGPGGPVIPTGGISYALAGLTVQHVANPVLTHAPASGTASVVEIRANDVSVTGAHRLRNTAATGRTILVDSSLGNLTGWTYADATIDYQGASGLYPVYVNETALYYASGTFRDVTSDPGVATEDTFGVGGVDPATAGTIWFIRCRSKNARNSSTSNGFALDKRTLAILIDCEVYDCGGPAIASGAVPGLTGRAICIGGRIERSNLLNVSTNVPAIYAEQVSGMTLIDVLDGIVVTSDGAVGSGSGSVEGCYIQRDQSRYNASSGDYLCRAVKVSVAVCTVSGNHMKGYKWAKSLSYYHSCVETSGLSAGFKLSVTGNFLEDCATGLLATGVNGSVEFLNNHYYADSLDLQTAGLASVVWATGASAGGMELSIGGNVVSQNFDKASFTNGYWAVASNATVKFSGRNYWWNLGTGAFSGWSAAGTDNGAGTRTGSGNRPTYDLSATPIPAVGSPALGWGPSAARYGRPTAAVALSQVDVRAVLGVSLSEQLAKLSNVASLATAAAVAAVDAKTSQLAFTGGDVHATLDGETVALSAGQSVTSVLGNVHGVIMGDADPGLIVGEGCRVDRVTGNVEGKVLGGGLSGLAGVGVRTENGSAILSQAQATDTKVTAVKAKTDALPAAPAAVGDVTAARDAILAEGGDGPWAGGGGGIGGGLLVSLTIKDDLDQVVPDAVVDIFDAGGNTLLGSFGADDNGQVEIDPAADTEYRVGVRAPRLASFAVVSKTWTESGADTLTGNAITIPSASSPPMCVVYANTSDEESVSRYYAELADNPGVAGGVFVAAGRVDFEPSASVPTRQEAELARGMTYFITSGKYRLDRVRVTIPDLASADLEDLLP